MIGPEYSAKKYILGTKVDFGLTRMEVLEQIESILRKDGSNYVCTTNPEFIIEAKNDPTFRDIINNSYLSIPDGVGVLLAKNYLEGVEKFRRGPLFALKALLYGLWLGVSLNFSKDLLGERIAGVDLVEDLVGLSHERGYTIFLLGGGLGAQEDIAQVAKDRLLEKYPRARIIGATSRFSPSENDDATTLSYIHECLEAQNVTGLDILFVAYGHGNQEKWIVRNSAKIPAKISVGVGGTLDYLSGRRIRPSSFFRALNLEWLVRLVKQPHLRIVRVAKAVIVFPLMVYRSVLGK